MTTAQDRPFRRLRGLAAALLVGTACGTAAPPPPQPPAAPREEDQAPPPSPPDPEHNLVKNSQFDGVSMLPWMASLTPPAAGEASLQDSALCLHLEAAGANPWDAQLRHREMTVKKGLNYAVQFKAWATRPTKATAKVGMSGPPYSDYWNRAIELSSEPQEFTFNFTMGQPDDPTVEFAFHLGGSNLRGEGPIDVCLDDLIVANPEFTPPPPQQAAPPPAIRVNQVGYLPALPKLAVWVTPEKKSAEWQLLDDSGQQLAKGKTKPLHADPASGDSLQLIDFSAHTQAGTGLTLQVGEDVSDPVTIGEDLYTAMKYDAFKYFYYNRSGVKISKKHSARADLARPAGHPKDVAPCAPDIDCKYSLDVTGGWYDAGDYGKYVVNAGISVWTLMNWYERTTHIEGADQEAFADGKANIPESGNQLPDVLDEARWELEFMLRMQVPEGEALAGMVHHKMHDVEWTAVGLAPHESKVKRFLRPPSTAATLNLAATAAQGARIWKELDAAFSEKLLAAAERAFSAAQANPELFAPPEDTNGGGPYDDTNVQDEFFWAAAELFITTQKPEYKAVLRSNKLNTRVKTENVGAAGVMSWQQVDTLGRISLATVPSPLPQRTYRGQVTRFADALLRVIKKEGYRLPLAPGSDGGYPWGSNATVINNTLVLALAYDFNPRKRAYLEGAQEGMNYLLGRNATGRSYVTGHGQRPVENPHHRFWAHQLSAAFPKAPAGALSGGPNSGLQDPYVKAAGLKGCAPQKCYADHIEAWSANEITINWNAPLFWVSAWLDEHSS